ncbi:Bug family tripartite tricarboxylate transporter substrate binding protein [Vreelandella malpeensis]|uniref:Tripartite tricarboxylate transporter substrate binding protein n=1 Tax=Vreelandella malpeensis TaxID=1172368 RepID=A0ABS8DNN2_9GAMM|nr:tripartite tricarboxylate transporter substrate binding protein [Halomonas malpeensis]MCB8887884.1 tripartite tricarboxylate transporter substrate binding protein [Halomonas malpeensis]
MPLALAAFSVFSRGTSPRAFASLGAASCLALGGMALGLSPQAKAETWPDRPIEIIVPFDAGGSADRLARGLAEHLSPRLGVPVTVLNRPGGAGALGATYFQQQPADGDTLLVMQAAPYLASAIEVSGAPVTWSDFALLSAQWNDYGIVAVHDESPYDTLEQLIEAMREPGQVSSGIIVGNGGHIQTLMMMDALEIDHDNVRFVTYSGGAPLRTALAGNQVDFEILAAEAALTIEEEIRPLAVVHDQQSDDWDAPLLNDALADLGVEALPLVGGNVTGLMVHASLEQEYPERYARLLKAYRETLESDEFTTWADQAAIGADWVSPEESQALIDAAYEAIQQYAPLIK